MYFVRVCSQECGTVCLERTVPVYIFARSVAVTGPAKWCILSGSPAGIQNSYLKFYVA